MNKKQLILLSFFIPAICRIDESLRLSSHPFISGDSFRILSQHRLESDSPISIQKIFGFNPRKVRYKDIVFVEGALLKTFFSDYHHRIRNPYILITHNADESCPREYRDYLEDSKIIMWFASNTDYRHRKLVAIPIGLSNRHWLHSRHHHEMIERKQIRAAGRNNQIDTHKKLLRRSRPTLLYVNFSWNTNPAARKPVWDKFYNSKEKYILSASGRQQEEYLNDILNSKFTLSPPGNGLDCHRTWEALWLGSIPVMMSSHLDQLFEDLPVLIIRDWNQVTESFLNQKYQEIIQKNYRFEKMYMQYWRNLILSAKG